MSNPRSLVRGRSGFTIVETLIVIAVSSLLLTSSILLVAGQQRKVEFSQAAQDIRSNIERVISETSAGHYPNSGFSCTANSSNVTITVSAVDTQGRNTNCIFLGRALQFGNGGDTGTYVVHTVTGYQHNNGSLAAAIPRLIPENAAFDGSRTVSKLNNGLTVVSMRYVSGGVPADISTVAFLQSLGEVDTNNNMLSGSQQTMLVPIPASGTVNTATIGSTVLAAGNQLRNNPPINPDGGVQICLVGGAGRWAQITIGSNGRSLSVTLDYKSAVCWT
jgi:type II secretory pathway pseudopilin PulG